MPKPLRHEDSPPRPIHDRAIQDLSFIRATMERASSFTAVPGWGGVAMGLTACAACVFAARQASPAEWLAVWLAEAIVALGVGGWALVRKAAATNTPLLSRAGRLFAGSFAPAVVAGAILTPLLYRLGLSGYLPGMWLVLYGAAVTSGGAFSVRIVPITGVAFMSVGITALVLGPQWKDLMMGFGFGLIHVVSGFVIARRYGG